MPRLELPGDLGGGLRLIRLSVWGKSGLVIASAAGGDALFTLPYRFDTRSVWHTILKGHNANR